VAEVVCAFLGCERLEDLSNSIPQIGDGSLCALSQKGLELGEGQFDRVQVWGVGWLEEKLCPSSFDQFSDRIAFVGGQVVRLRIRGSIDS
jgi:hypothetical protein